MTSGKLRKNEIGRYELGDSYELTSGSLITFKYDGKWVNSSIEFGNDEYYIVDYPSVNLDNLLIKIEEEYL